MALAGTRGARTTWRHRRGACRAGLSGQCLKMWGRRRTNPEGRGQANPDRAMAEGMAGRGHAEAGVRSVCRGMADSEFQEVGKRKLAKKRNTPQARCLGRSASCFDPASRPLGDRPHTPGTRLSPHSHSRSRGTTRGGSAGPAIRRRGFPGRPGTGEWPWPSVRRIPHRCDPS